jgi:hypothetical protein
MESVAPPGGVMLSESTARLVDNAVELGEPELVAIKGTDTPVAARRLLEDKPHTSTPTTYAYLRICCESEIQPRHFLPSHLTHVVDV